MYTHQWYYVHYYDFHAHMQGNATNKIIYAVFKYIHVYYTCDNSNREHSEILKRFFDKLVDIEINIIFKI